MEAITLFKLRYLLEYGYISVGDIVHTLDVIKELVTVLDNHQLVTSDESVFLILNCSSRSHIILDGAPVRTA